MKVRTFGWKNPFLFPCEGEGGDAGGGAAGGGDAGGGGGAAGGGGANDKKFSQDDLNKALAKEKEKTRQQNAALIQQLEELKSIKSLSDEQRSNFEKQIEELQNQSLTKEQLAQKEQEKIKTEYSTKLKTAEETGTKWKGKYEGVLVDHALAAAASKAKAFNPVQIEALLRPHSRVADVLEDGKPTGKSQVLVDFTYTDDKGKPVTLTGINPDEALKVMKDQEQYANLFIDEGTGGVGGSGSRQGGNRNKTAEDIAKMTPEQFREYRKKNPNIL